jgi:hypothetical protein
VAALPPIPLHLATLGLLDNQIGAATLGYIVGPAVVPRFPAEGTVRPEEYVGVISEQGELVAQLEACEWAGVVETPLDLDGIVESLFWRAAVQADDFGQGEVAGNRPFAGEVSDETDPTAGVEEGDDLVAEVTEVDGTAEVTECEKTAALEEKPGEGRCK